MELRDYLKSILSRSSAEKTNEEILNEDTPVIIFGTNATLRRQMGWMSFDFGLNSSRPDLG